jgi:hypothetical protein
VGARACREARRAAAVAVRTTLQDGAELVSSHSHRNGDWRVNLDAHPKLGALVGNLLELHFFLLGHPYLVIETQVGSC